MPTRQELDTSINAKIAKSSSSDRITDIEHRAVNKEILDYVDQQDAALAEQIEAIEPGEGVTESEMNAAISAATNGLASQSYVNSQIAAAISAAMAAYGIPAGGTTGQALVKASNTDYDTEWANVGAVDPDPMVEYTSVASDPYTALQ